MFALEGLPGQTQIYIFFLNLAGGFAGGFQLKGSESGGREAGGGGFLCYLVWAL